MGIQASRYFSSRICFTLVCSLYSHFSGAEFLTITIPLFFKLTPVQTLTFKTLFVSFPRTSIPAQDSCDIDCYQSFLYLLLTSRSPFHITHSYPDIFGYLVNKHMSKFFNYIHHPRTIVKKFRKKKNRGDPAGRPMDTSVTIIRYWCFGNSLKTPAFGGGEFPKLSSISYYLTNYPFQFHIWKVLFFLRFIKIWELVYFFQPFGSIILDNFQIFLQILRDIFLQKLRTPQDGR